MTNTAKLTRALREAHVRINNIGKAKLGSGPVSINALFEAQRAAKDKYFDRPAFAWAFDELTELVNKYCAPTPEVPSEKLESFMEDVNEFLEDIAPFWDEMLKDDPELAFYKGKLEKLVKQI